MYAGFANIGATCWLNAGLQCLRAVGYAPGEKAPTELAAALASTAPVALVARLRRERFAPGPHDTLEFLQWAAENDPAIERDFSILGARLRTCTVCAEKSVKETSDIALALPPGRELKAAVYAYFSSTRVDDFECDKCRRKTPAVVQDVLRGSLPLVMTFWIQGSAYPLDFTLNDARYVLAAVAIHTGGHWLAIGRAGRGGWVECDDTFVRARPDPFSPMARVLLYRRI